MTGKILYTVYNGTDGVKRNSDELIYQFHEQQQGNQRERSPAKRLASLASFLS